MVRLRTDQQVQISRGQVLVPQSRHNIRRERVVSDPSQHNFTKLKRLVRYFKGERQWIHVFECGNMSSEVTVFSDSDCAGDKETRKSSSAVVALAGRHLLTALTRQQKIIARSSAEAEWCAAALGASDAKGVQSLMCDLGFCSDASAYHRCKSDITHAPSTWSRRNETHRRSAFVVAVGSQIEQVGTPPRQE